MNYAKSQKHEKKVPLVHTEIFQIKSDYQKQVEEYIVDL